MNCPNCKDSHTRNIHPSGLTECLSCGHKWDALKPVENRKVTL